MIKNFKLLNNKTVFYFNDNKFETFPNIWLRDHIKNKENWDFKTNQRITYTANLDINIKVKKAKLLKKGKFIEILWSDENKPTKYSYEFLKKNSLKKEETKSDTQFWKDKDIKNQIFINYKQLQTKVGFKNLLKKIHIYGFAVVRNCSGIECHTHEYIRTGHLDSKFGFDPDQVEPVLRSLVGQPWAQLTGLHAHIGSQIFELEPHRDLAAVMADKLKLARDLGHPVSDLNVGGGLGIRYVESDDPPSIEQWIQVVAEAVTTACQERSLELPRLMCEPGRSLVATAGVTLYSVGSRKTIPNVRTYVAIDGGMSDNPRPITYQSLYTCCLADRPLAKPDESVNLVGKHCESGDVLLKDLPLPTTESGDIVTVFATGAYNASMSSNYNRIPRPAAVLVHDGSAELVQKREQPDDLLRYDVLPERFNALR